MRVVSPGQFNYELNELVNVVIEFISRVTETPVQLRYHGRGRWYAKMKDTPDRVLMLDATFAVPATAFVKAHHSINVDDLNPMVYVVDIELAQEAIITYSEQE